MNSNLVKYILTSHQRVFLFSHMRSRSSLLSHIIGSHPDISGYYEFQQHYFSKKSMLKQKLSHAWHEKFDVKNSKYMFDKILHNDIIVDDNVLLNPNNFFIFMLRSPNSTIPSMLEMGKRKGESSPFNKLEHCEKYYFERLKKLQSLASSIKHSFHYINAETIVNQPEETLKNLSLYLELNLPLSQEYKLMNKTGKASFGDTSRNINSGKILKSTNSLPNAYLNSELTLEYEKLDSKLSKQSR